MANGECLCFSVTAEH